MLYLNLSEKHPKAGECTCFFYVMGGTFMWDWKENAECCFFTNRLDKRLNEFINSQKEFSSDEERWEFLFKNAYTWKRKYSVDFDRTILDSFFRQWDIYTFWGTFPLPAPAFNTPEETLYWILLTGWILTREYGKPERTSHFPSGDLNWMLQRVFQYPRKTCTWLHKQPFLDELKSIYDHSYCVFQRTNENPNPNLSQSEWTEIVKRRENEYSRFLSYHTFFQEHLVQPQILRLNVFKPDRNVRYLIKENQFVYYIQLSDFG